jgi:hypothetical protein
VRGPLRFAVPDSFHLGRPTFGSDDKFSLQLRQRQRPGLFDQLEMLLIKLDAPESQELDSADPQRRQIVPVMATKPSSIQK